jgi:glycosyl transferase family 2
VTKNAPRPTEAEHPFTGAPSSALPSAEKSNVLQTCIVIPVHNRRHFTLACLDRLTWCADDPHWKIILVDDASRDGTAEAVRSQHSHVEIVAGDGSLFWTGAMRLGMARGIEMGCTDFIWLNDDTLPDEASLRRIASLVQNDPRQLVASTPLLDGRPQASCSLKGRRVPPMPGTRQPADVLAGYQVAFSAKVVQRIGLPDSCRWPHYGGDSSFTRMAHNAGYALTVDGDSFISLTDIPPCFDVAELFWKNDEPLAVRMQRIFLSKRSRYRLQTLWHLDRLYRGTAMALLVSPARFVVMLWQIIRLRAARAFSKNSPRISE